MGVVRFHVNARAQNSHAAIVMLRGIVDQAFGDRPRIMPNGTASLRIQRIGIVRGGDKHEAVEYHRRDFQAIRVGRMEYPLREQLSDISGLDLIEAAKSAAPLILVVGQPIRAYGLRSKSFPRAFYRSRNGSGR